MVTPTKYFSTDPNKKGRGEGYYYHRGNGYYSKYSLARDKNKKSSGYDSNPIGYPNKSRYKHTTDGFIPSYLKKKYPRRKK